jgi:hypothetical protein
MSDLVNTPKIRQAIAAMNTITLQLDRIEGMLMLNGAVASLIADKWPQREWEEVRQEHDRAVERTLQHFDEARRQQRSKS